MACDIDWFIIIVQRL